MGGKIFVAVVIVVVVIFMALVGVWYSEEVINRCIIDKPEHCWDGYIRSTGHLFDSDVAYTLKCDGHTRKTGDECTVYERVTQSRYEAVMYTDDGGTK